MIIIVNALSINYQEKEGHGIHWATRAAEHSVSMSHTGSCEEIQIYGNYHRSNRKW